LSLNTFTLSLKVFRKINKIPISASQLWAGIFYYLSYSAQKYLIRYSVKLSGTLGPNDFNAWLDVCEAHREQEWDERKVLKNEQKFFSEKLHKTANTFEQWEKVEELFRISQVAFDKMLEKASSFDHWHKIYKVLKSVESYKYDDYGLRNPKISELEVLAKMAKKAKTLEQWGIILDGAREGQLWEKARKEIERMCGKFSV